MEEPVLTGVASEQGWAQLVLRGLPAEMQTMTTTLSRLTEAGVSVDLLTQVDRADGRRLVQITVTEAEAEAARTVCQAVVSELGGERVDVQDGLARLALVGSGMHRRPGVFAQAFETLHRESVAVHSVSAASTSIILMVNAADEVRAVRLLHDAFGLGAGA